MVEISIELLNALDGFYDHVAATGPRHVAGPSHITALRYPQAMAASTKGDRAHTDDLLQYMESYSAQRATGTG